ncbi:MAG: hypothetical protein DRQ41_00655 [Gammaproteobacteria bacterium]|nr:MAG: hypothetical protein DRQ41_00655 [Gammaproteobacteria bacterium]
MKINSNIFLATIITVATTGCVSTSQKASPPAATPTTVNYPETVSSTYPPTAQPQPGNAQIDSSIHPSAYQPATANDETPVEQDSPSIRPPMSGYFETLPSKALSDPKQVVQAYYQAISERNCAKAAQLRPGYTEERCYKIDSMNLKSAILVWEKPQISVVYVDILYKTGDKENSFFGYLKVIERGGLWLIVNDSYRSGRKMDLDEYLRAQKLS